MYALIFSKSVGSQSQKENIVSVKTFKGTFFLIVAVHNKYRQGETQHSKSSIEPNQLPHTNLVMDGPFSQQLSIMHSLGPGEDLLSSHEHVIRIGVFLAGKKKSNYILASQPQKPQILKQTFELILTNKS